MPLRELRPVASSFALWLVAISSSLPARAELRTFGNWIVGCDNKAECTALGTAESTADPAAPAVALRIGVDRTSLSGFEFAIIPLPHDNPTPRPITLTCLLCANGIRASGDEMADSVNLHGQRMTIPGMQGAHWLDALAKGRGIAVAWAGSSASSTIETSAFLEAWKHLAQRRGDLLRHIPMAEGLPSLHAGPPKESRKRAYPAREVMPSGYPGIVQMTKKCPPLAEVASYRQFALPGNADLWAVLCREGNTLTTHWYQAAGGADLPAALELPDGERSPLKAGEQGFAQSVFDFDFGILRARSGPAMREDCGIQRAWGWDGETWFLLERREMPACIGLSPSDWIRTYSSP
jgi:hypothetical protein